MYSEEANLRIKAKTTYPAVPQASVVVDPPVLLAVTALVVVVPNVIVPVVVIEGGATVVMEFVTPIQEHALE